MSAREFALACALLAGVGAALAATPGAQSNGDREPNSRFDERCRPEGSRLVAANRFARVYYTKEDSDLSYCRPGRSEPEITLVAQAAYPPPAISLAGPYLGYAGFAFEPGTNEYVVVADVRRNDDVSFIGDLVGGVGSLKINARGSVAWIVCPFGSVLLGELDCTATGRTGSRKDGSPRSIYRHDSRSTEEEPVQLVARGRDIEVGSLRRKGNRIYWKQSGKKSASLL